jgi:subtilisin family serine protease
MRRLAVAVAIGATLGGALAAAVAPARGQSPSAHIASQPSSPVAAASAGPSARARPRIEKAADLPRFSYRIDGRVEDLVRSQERFAPFGAAVRADLQSVLDGYDIDDKATRRRLLGTLASLDFLDGRYDAALARLEEIRALQDKPAEKLMSGLRLRVMATVAKTEAPGSPGYPKAVGDALARELATLPYAVVQNDIKSAKSGTELMGEALMLAGVREVLQPIVDRSGSLSSDFAPSVVDARMGLVAVLPLKPMLVDAYAGYLAAHRVDKPDIWKARDVVLDPAQVKAPVVIGIWDSGVDTRIFPDRLVRGSDGAAAVGFDRYARRDDRELQALDAAQQAALPRMLQRVKGFSDLRSAIDSPEASEVKALLSSLPADKTRTTLEELRLAGNYAHGTHVAGIALAGNPGARLAVGRIEFGHTLQPDPCPSRELAVRESAAAQATVDGLKARGARVVNMSWGGNVRSIETDLEQCGSGATPDARKALARELFESQKAALTKAFASAPEILFVAAAGNSNNDASFIESIPGSIVAPNVLTVGAVDSAGDEASFTSYGPTVKVHANGYQVESYLPGGSRVALSGTSMAAPQVANLAGKLLAVNPTLTPEALVRLIVGTAETRPDGRRHLVDPRKALAAATAS